MLENFLQHVGRVEDDLASGGNGRDRSCEKSLDLSIRVKGLRVTIVVEYLILDSI